MHFRSPSLKALRTFESVVRLRSLTAAADELHVSTGAISHQIRALEEQLGFHLFERSAAGLVPTIAAIELAEQVREGLNLISGGVRRFRLGGAPNSLTIGCDVTFGVSWLGPRMARFLDVHPEIEVGMDLVDPGPDPTWRTVDVTIHFGYGRFPKYESVQLTSESLSPVCAPNYALGASTVGAIRSPADLLRCRLLHVPWLEPDTIFGTLTWHSWFARAGVETQGVKLSGLQLSHTTNALQLAMAGKGAALASDCLTADAIASGALVRPFDVRLELPRHYYLVCSESIADLPKVVAFRDWLLAETAPFRSS